MKKNTIRLKNYSNVFEELVAAAAITPGHLVELNSDGKAQVHANAGLNALPMFAEEDDNQGNGIDVEYAADDPVRVWIPGRGDMVNAILADGQNVAIGDFLESAGDGTLQKHVADSSGAISTNQIVGVALEALDLSDSSGAESSGALGYDKRIQIRVA